MNPTQFHPAPLIGHAGFTACPGPCLPGPELREQLRLANRLVYCLKAVIIAEGSFNGGMASMKASRAWLDLQEDLKKWEHQQLQLQLQVGGLLTAKNLSMRPISTCRITQVLLRMSGSPVSTSSSIRSLWVMLSDWHRFKRSSPVFRDCTQSLAGWDG